MPRGQKTKYTDRQRRLADEIEAGYKRRGLGQREAERRAWATVNKIFGGGEKPGGAGYGRPLSEAPSRKGGRIGGAASARRPAARRSAAAKKAARTRARKRKKR